MILDVVYLDVRIYFLNGDLNNAMDMKKSTRFVCSNNNKFVKLIRIYMTSNSSAEDSEIRK